jgi:TDG/mug DNA glycosylase family protein
VDERTVEAYDRGARVYVENRRAYHPDRAEELAGLLPPGSLRLDLGSGPGHYLPHLGRPVVAADAALAMVREALAAHGGPGVSGVAADLEALPFERGAFDGVWASKCLQHVPGEQLPLALAGLHRTLAVGGLLDATLFTGEGSEVRPAEDEFPGRLFSWWRPEALRHVLVGAGFDVEAIEVDAPPAGSDGDGHARMTVRARRARTLADTVGPGMRLLICGLNPSIYAADAGIGFARANNRFWTAARAAGIVAVDRDPSAALRRHGVGMTDIVKRATVAASELTTAEYRAGLVRVEHLVRWLRPGAICFVGLAGWRAAVDRRAGAGVQPERLGGVPVYVMPSTSGLNARVPVGELADHLRAAADLAGRRPDPAGR